MAATQDRTYWTTGGAWHALEREEWVGSEFLPGLCGRSNRYAPDTQTADRVPRDGHLCGVCARIIAARTDIEPGF